MDGYGNCASALPRLSVTGSDANGAWKRGCAGHLIQTVVHSRWRGHRFAAARLPGRSALASGYRPGPLRMRWHRCNGKSSCQYRGKFPYAGGRHGQQTVDAAYARGWRTSSARAEHEDPDAASFGCVQFALGLACAARYLSGAGGATRTVRPRTNCTQRRGEMQQVKRGVRDNSRRGECSRRNARLRVCAQNGDTLKCAVYFPSSGCGGIEVTFRTGGSQHCHPSHHRQPDCRPATRTTWRAGHGTHYLRQPLRDYRSYKATISLPAGVGQSWPNSDVWAKPLRSSTWLTSGS